MRKCGRPPWLLAPVGSQPKPIYNKASFCLNETPSMHLSISHTRHLTSLVRTTSDLKGWPRDSFVMLETIMCKPKLGTPVFSFHCEQSWVLSYASKNIIRPKLLLGLLMQLRPVLIDISQLHIYHMLHLSLPLGFIMWCCFHWTESAEG